MPEMHNIFPVPAYEQLENLFLYIFPYGSPLLLLYTTCTLRTHSLVIVAFCSSSLMLALLPFSGLSSSPSPQGYPERGRGICQHRKSARQTPAASRQRQQHSRYSSFSLYTSEKEGEVLALYVVHFHCLSAGRKLREREGESTTILCRGSDEANKRIESACVCYECTGQRRKE